MIVTARYTGGPRIETEQHRRSLVETLTLRAPLLENTDRTLITLYLDDHHSFGQIARLTGASPTTVARRIRRIVRQLRDDTYPLCLVHRSQFNRVELSIIRDHFVRGHSCKQISRRRGHTYYRVRTTILKAKELAHSPSSQETQTNREESDS